MEAVPTLLELATLSACRAADDAGCAAARALLDRERGADRFAHAVGEASRLRSAGDQLVDLAVARARVNRISWQEIADSLGVTRQAAESKYKARVANVIAAALFPIRETALGLRAVHLPGTTDPVGELARLDRWAAELRPEGGAAQATAVVGSDSYSDIVEQERDLFLMVDQARAAAFDPSEESPLPDGVSRDYARRRRLQAKVAVFEAIAREDPDLAEDALASARTARARVVEALVDELRPQLEVDWSGGLAGHLELWNLRIATIERVGGGPDGLRDRDLEDGWWLYPRPADGSEVARRLDVADDAPRHVADQAAIDLVAAAVAEDLAHGRHPYRAGGFAPKNERPPTLA
ncbi:MAG: hypothetical protein REI11_11575 [Patulibacter sp.]|nr:hypothetical protein [Patulibacter sp.]